MNDKQLNILFDAALEFGPNWRRSIRDLANERLPGLGPDECDELSILVGKARDEIEKYISEHFKHGGKREGLTVSQNNVICWIKKNFPWMNYENISHAVSQGIYYAYRE